MKTATSPKVLLVEDDPTSGAILSACVHRAGCTPIGPATNAQDALELFNLTAPKAVIVDVGLSGNSDGISFAKMIRVLDPTVPILFVTGAEDPAVFTQTQAVRPLAFFMKPFDPLSFQRTLLLAIQHGPDPVPPSRDAVVPVIDRNGVFVREGTRLTRLTPDNITCVQTDEKHCVIVTSTGRRHAVRVPLRELLHYLYPAELARVHRSWLVNMGHIEHINPLNGTILLTGGTEAPLGRAYREDFLQRVRLVE